MGAFNSCLQRCHNKLSYSISVLSAQCLLMSGTGKSKQALQLSSTQGWRAVSLEGAMPAQHWANAQSMQRCSYNVCRSLSAQARAHGSALLDPLMHPWDHHPSQYHPAPTGYFSGVSANLEPVPGQGWSLAFPPVSVLRALRMVLMSALITPALDKRDKDGQQCGRR